tara:strand:- start:2047 stop:2184 length:138 start_codon:yes stop_codon:yes gene_type:complete
LRLLKIDKYITINTFIDDEYHLRLRPFHRGRHLVALTKEGGAGRT